jgi:hypothetical protein
MAIHARKLQSYASIPHNHHAASCSQTVLEILMSTP